MLSVLSAGYRAHYFEGDSEVVVDDPVPHSSDVLPRYLWMGSTERGRHALYRFAHHL